MDRINEIFYGVKPVLNWVDAYFRHNGEFVSGHIRTIPNTTINDNLITDVDEDGIDGFFDVDADGNGITDSLGCGVDVIIDEIDIDGDGIIDGFSGIDNLLVHV